MKKFLILVIAMSVFVIFNSNDAFAGIPAPDGKVWRGPAGATFANGETVDSQIYYNANQEPIGAKITCLSDSRCCWEITDGGKNLEIYTISVPPKDGPIEDSESVIVAVPESTTGNN